MNAPLRLAAIPIAKPNAEECEIDYGRACATIPEGVYRAVLIHHETAFVFKTPKVFVWFRLIDPGPYFGRLIYAVYRARKLKGKPGMNRAFNLSARSELFIMLCRVLDVRGRPDRISLAGLRDRVLQVRVTTVTQDYKQRALPEGLQYSKIAEIVGCDTG